jgi:hypothetical protein
VGTNALHDNNNGFYNTAVGYKALFQNSGEGFNPRGTGQSTQPLDDALRDARTAPRTQSVLTHSKPACSVRNWPSKKASLSSGHTRSEDNIALGKDAGGALETGICNIYIGNVGVADDSNTIRIGTPFDNGTGQSLTFIAGISGTGTFDDAEPVLVTAKGQLCTDVQKPSAARFKKEIRPMDKTSEAILALKPVSFRFKSDSKGTPQFGLIAEEVAKVNPDLVVRNRMGEIYSVRYEAVNAMLLNEFLKEHRKNEEQEATIARQQKQIEALTEGLQK